MARNLEQAMARFAAAGAKEITYFGSDWPELENYLSTLRGLLRLSETLVPSQDVSEVMRKLRRAGQILRTVPIRGDHDEVGLATLLEGGWPAAGREFTDALNHCRRAAEALVGSPGHPAMKATERLVADVRKEDAAAIVHAVVVRHCLRAMEVVDEEHDLDLNVVDLTRAKWSDVGALCILFGTPYLLSSEVAFSGPDRAARVVSWLFHAPIAPRVSVLSWTGNPAFKPEMYNGFPGQTVELSNPRGPFNFHFEWQDTQAADLPPLPPAIARGEEESDGEPIESRAILLADNLWVHYADHVGPRPERCVADDFQVSLETVKRVSQLRPGDIIAVGEDDASREFIDKESRRLLSERHGASQPDLSYKARDRFQSAVRDLELQVDGAQRLKRAGLDDWQVAYRFRLSHDRAHIAPDDHSEYLRIARACGLEVEEDEWDHIRRLRASRKMAGRNARAIIDKSIREDDSWMDEIDVPRSVRVSLSGLGAVILSRVIAIAPDPVLVPVSRLGHVVRSKS